MKIPYNILIQIKMSVRPYFKGFTLIFFFYNCRKQEYNSIHLKKMQLLFYIFLYFRVFFICGRMFGCFIALDDLLNERMTYDIQRSQLRKSDAFDPLQQFLCAQQPAVAFADQIDLRHISGNDDLGVKAHPGQKHLHL